MFAECPINGTRQSWLCRYYLWRVLFAECGTRRTICRVFYVVCRVFRALGKLKESGSGGYNSSFGCCPKAEYSAGPTYSGKGLWTLQIVWFVARLMNLQNTSSSTARLQYSSGMLLGCRHLKATIQIICIVFRSYPIALTNSTVPLSLYAAGNCGKEGTVSYSGTSTRA